MDEFSSKCRNIVRKSLSKNLQVVFDFDGYSLHEFEHLYNMMALKNNIPSYYKFKFEFFKDTFEFMKGHIFTINIMCDEKYISSSMFLHYNNYMHYHLSANNPDYFHLAGNSLILYEACKWGKDHGVTALHLGGVGRSESEKPLMHFKKQFTKKGILPFFVGEMVLDDHIYNQIVFKSGNTNDNYFPKYRG